jgi:multiple sugar transport system ATP-binding protein
MIAVKFDRVCKRYPGGIAALHELDLQVAPGERIVLLGPSGCGKTTTLRLLAGLEQPTSGAIRLGGQPAAGLSPRERDVGFVFQRPALYPHLKVRDNLAFGWRMQHPRWRSAFAAITGKVSAHSPDDQSVLEGRIDEAARLLKIGGLLDRFPRQLSGGEQQRVSLGRVLVRRPALLLLDEPFSSLDQPLRAEMRKELHSLLDRLSATMFYVTHDPVEAAALADRIVVMRNGIVEQADAPDALFRRPSNRFVAGYVGWPSMNFLEGRLTNENGQRGILFGQDFVPLPTRFPALDLLEGQEIIVGIRPESMHSEGAGANLIPLEMRLEGVEMLGDHCLANLRRGNSVVTALVRSCTIWQTPGLADREASRTFKVYLDMATVHLFDRKTGKALGVGRSSSAPYGKPEG